MSTTPPDRAKVASAGWARWAPVNAAAVGVHLISGVGLIAGNRKRLAHQSGARTNTIIKAALTGAGLASTVYSGAQGAKVAAAGKVPATGGTIPSDQTPAETASAMQQLRIAQWVTPAVTAVLIVSALNKVISNAPVRSLMCCPPDKPRAVALPVTVQLNI